MEQPSSPQPFSPSVVRRMWYEGRWFYSVVDVVAALASSDRPIFYPKPGHLLKVGDISGQQRGVLRQCDARNLQIHRSDAQTLLPQLLRNCGRSRAEGEQGNRAKQLKVTLHEAVGSDLLLKRT